jgi:hypothetical protein
MIKTDIFKTKTLTKEGSTIVFLGVLGAFGVIGLAMHNF